MKYPEKRYHLRFLKIALALTLFCNGYFITKLFFEFQELRKSKEILQINNSAIICLLNIKADFEKDYFYKNFEIQTAVRNIYKSEIDVFYLNDFYEANHKLVQNDQILSQKFIEIKRLTKNYLKSKNQIVDYKDKANLNLFNQNASKLLFELDNIDTYLQKKVARTTILNDQLFEKSRKSGILIAVISFIIFILTYLKMNFDMHRLQKMNGDLLFLNETLSNAEMVAGYGSWKYNTETETFLFSDNFFRLLNIKDQKVEPSVATILNFVHPDDREVVKKTLEDSLRTKKSTSLIYRNLLPDGTIKYMMSVGKFINNSKGELVKIGVSQDISALIKKTNEIEKNNEKLIAINAELESFNNIASHDLQEPLRKIQMFISRIETKEFLETAKSSTITYFEKIKLSAERMQSLISDLINYTKTVKGDRVYEKIDLNHLFTGIIEEFSHKIEEQNAVIEVGDLPVIEGIKFQVQQLFVNLISNALKYSKSGIKPIITVKFKNFENEMVNNINTSGTDFYKIDIADNGIGFDQQYADQIFMLFKRLPTESKHKGTGLGLAICKKIIAAHQGYIQAISEIDNGSTFSVYFPKYH